MTQPKENGRGITLAEAAACLGELQHQIWMTFTGGPAPDSGPFDRHSTQARELDELLSELLWLDRQLLEVADALEPCCPQPEAQGAEADPRSAGDLGRERAAVGNTATEGAGRQAGRAATAPAAQASPCYILIQVLDGKELRQKEIIGWETVPFDPDLHRVPKHPPSRQRVPGCDCVACTGRPRLNRGWRR